MESGMKASQALAGALGSLQEKMHGAEQGIREGADPERLHDFRVAIRASRSLLTQVRGVFPKRARQRFQSALAWLAGSTGAKRDLDVFLAELHHSSQQLPKELQGPFQALRETLKQHQRTEHQRLLAILASRRYQGFQQGYAEFLAKAQPRGSRMPQGLRSIREVSGEAAWRNYRKLARQALAITPESPIEDLHELRKTGKKLRYLLQIFQGLYPPEEIHRQMKALKQLQDKLGAVVDHDVRCKLLARWAEEMTGNDETRAAFNALANIFLRPDPGSRPDFENQLRDFLRPRNRKRFKTLFKPHAGADPPCTPAKNLKLSREHR
jgi:CHAD domain-containing protein